MSSASKCIQSQECNSSLSDFQKDIKQELDKVQEICCHDPSNLDEYLMMRRDSVSNRNLHINPKKFFKGDRYSGNDGANIDSGYGDDTYSSLQSIQKFGFLDPMTGTATQIVYNMLNIHEATSAILECGCGTEYILPYLVQMKKKNCKLFLTDISKVKLNVIQHKCELIEKDPLNSHIYNYNFIPKIEDENIYYSHDNCVSNQDQECENKNIPNKPSGLYFNKNLNVFVERADATNLPYSNQAFDIYFGGMLIQEVKDPFASIKEAYRVLKKGGRAGFTILDTEKNNNDFDEIMIRAIQKVTGARAEFSFSDQQDILSVRDLKVMLERAGFKNILIWSQFIPYNFFTKDDYESHLDKDTINEQNIQIKNQALLLFEEKLRRENTPFGMNILCLVAQKLD